MSEAAIKRSIMLALGNGDVRLFNNPVGNGWMGRVIAEAPGRSTLAEPRRLAFGLHPGSADLIGWRSLTVTPADVGRTLAVLASIEVKSATGQPRPDQIAWAEAVRAAGGLAGVARSPAQARLILGLAP